MSFDFLKEVINVSPITIVSTLLVLFFGILYFLLKDRDLPPGPTGLPLVGYWPFLRNDDIHVHLTELMEKYGDVYTFNVAGKLFVHLGSVKSIKEAHLAKADCFTERCTDYGIYSVIFGKGVITINGEEWKVLRKFFIQSFRNYGLISMKEYMAGPIYDSLRACIENLKATNGSPVNIITIFNDRSFDIFRNMMFNDGEITDEELRDIIECYQNVVLIFHGKNLLLMGEFARYFIFPKIKNYKFALENHTKMQEYITKLIRRHEKTYSENIIRDVIDSYIKERNDRRKKGDPTAEYFSEDALVSSLVQFVGDGIFAIAVFTGGFINALLEYPEEQEKIYKELEDVIGPDRQITLEDRNKLPYTNAFMQEVLRTTDFLTYLPSLVCTKETTLNGYRIPKGAILMTNFWSSMRDPNVFDEPHKFKPSRYRNEPGKPKTEAPVIFGVGKRYCAGEFFVMMQVFLFLTTVIRNFRLERPKENTKKHVVEGQLEVCAYPRK